MLQRQKAPGGRPPEVHGESSGGARSASRSMNPSANASTGTRGGAGVNCGQILCQNIQVGKETRPSGPPVLVACEGAAGYLEGHSDLREKGLSIWFPGK
ncbi:unnamed protein product, partial [Laminaria digitata]